MGTQYNNPQNFVEMIDDIRCTINTIDEVIDGYLKILGIQKSHKKTKNFCAVYNGLEPKEDYKIYTGNNFVYGLFVMHEIRNKFGHEERTAHSLDEIEKNIGTMKGISSILAEGEKHPLLDKNDSELIDDFSSVESELEEVLKQKSIDCLYREHEYWFGKYKDFLQNYYDRQEMEDYYD